MLTALRRRIFGPPTHVHRWDEPHHKEFLKETGIHFAFFSEGIQKGSRRCQECGEEQKVYRVGFLGIDGSGGEWQPLTAKMEEYIDSLPVL